jgi:hypothetical protein
MKTINILKSLIVYQAFAFNSLIRLKFSPANFDVIERRATTCKLPTTEFSEIFYLLLRVHGYREPFES